MNGDPGRQRRPRPVPSVDGSGIAAGSQRPALVDLSAAGLEAAGGDAETAIRLAILRLRQRRPDDARVRDELLRSNLARALTAASIDLEIARAVRSVAVPLLASSAHCRAWSTALRGRVREMAARRRAPGREDFG